MNEIIIEDDENNSFVLPFVKKELKVFLALGIFFEYFLLLM